MSSSCGRCAGDAVVVCVEAGSARLHIPTVGLLSHCTACWRRRSGQDGHGAGRSALGVGLSLETSHGRQLLCFRPRHASQGPFDCGATSVTCHVERPTHCSRTYVGRSRPVSPPFTKYWPEMAEVQVRKLAPRAVFPRAE
jgi:hypothetical protein